MMPVQIAFLLTLLAAQSLADSNALEEFSFEDGKNTSEIKLDGQYKRGFILKSVNNAKPYGATLFIPIGNHDGIVISYRIFGNHVNLNRFDCRGDGSNLPAKNLYGNVGLCRNNTRFLVRRFPAVLVKNHVVAFVSAWENNTGRYELSVTTFSKPPCSGEEFECGTRICVWAKLRCDARDNCGDGSDERGCSSTLACEHGSDREGCKTGSMPGYKPSPEFYVFLYVALGIVFVVCLIYIGIRWQGVFKRWCTRRTGELPTMNI